MPGHQSTMERFLKRKQPYTVDSENHDGVTSPRDEATIHTDPTTHRSSRISRRDINWDELPYDPANRRRISDYIGEKLQNEVRRKYLSRGPCRPPPSFPEVLEVLQYVEKEGPSDAKRHQARGLMDYLKDFDFIFHLHLMLLILGHANSLSLSLQRKDKDILEAMVEVKLTKQKLQQIRDDGWNSLLENVYSFCEEHNIPKLDMEEDYIDRHKPRRKTNRTNYQHYSYDCLNLVIDLQLAEFNDRFDEVNSKLLTQIVAFNPKNSFEAFKVESLMELAKSYPEDFDSIQLKDLGRELCFYIDNVRADERLSKLNSISELARLMVETKKHLAFPLVYRLLKLVLVLPIATATVERCFSAMKIVKTVLRNRIGDEFMNDCIVCFVEQGFLETISNEDVIVRFQKMADRRENLDL